jgi:hypothetical protein
MAKSLRQNFLLLLIGLFLSVQFALAYHNVVHPVEPQFALAKHTDGDHQHKDNHDDCNICAIGKGSSGGFLFDSVVIYLPTLLAVSIEAPHDSVHSSLPQRSYNAQAPPALS